MPELRSLILAAVIILGVFLTACSKDHTDRAAVPGPASLPASVQPIAPMVPKESKEMPPQPEASPVPKTPSADSSESYAEPEISEPVPSTPSGEASAAEAAPAEQRRIDIDLTGFSPNMLYAEVSNMGLSPEDYKGKIIRLTGEFAHFPKDVDENGNPTSTEEIFVCMISDAMACCASGIEFIPEKESSFWASPPEVGSKITITGLCDIFLDESGWFTVIQLDNAAVEQGD